MRGYILWLTCVTRSFQQKKLTEVINRVVKHLMIIHSISIG